MKASLKSSAKRDAMMPTTTTDAESSNAWLLARRAAFAMPPRRCGSSNAASPAKIGWPLLKPLNAKMRRKIDNDGSDDNIDETFKRRKIVLLSRPL